MRKTTKILVSALLTLCMLLPMAMPAFATTPTEEPGINGTTTEWKTYYSALTTDEYMVSTANGLLAIAEIINADPNGFANKTVRLTNDMVFNEGWDANTETAPANKWTAINNFKGTFNGDGHTISGLYVKGTANYTGGMFGPLFDNATVENFAIVNSYFEGAGEYHAGVIGRINANGVTVRDIYADIIVKSTSAAGGGVGGIIGLVSHPNSSITEGENKQIPTLENLVFDGTVKQINVDIGRAGAIVGHVADYRYTLVTLSDCLNLGTVNAKACAGAFVGYGSTVVLNRCVNLGTVTSETAANNAGALVGTIQKGTGGQGLTINDCYNLSSNAVSDSAYTTVHTVTVITKDGVKGNAAKTALSALDFDGTDANKNDWTLRSAGVNYASEDQYPLPTAIYENLFKVKLAYYQTTDLYDTNKYDLRIIAEIDSLDYAKAGFKVTRELDDKTLDVDTTEGVKVYKTVTGGGEDVTAVGDKYFVTITITGISGAQTITVTPYTSGTADGELVEGTAMELSFDANGNLIKN